MNEFKGIEIDKSYRLLIAGWADPRTVRVFGLYKGLRMDLGVTYQVFFRFQNDNESAWYVADFVAAIKRAVDGNIPISWSDCFRCSSQAIPNEICSVMNNEFSGSCPDCGHDRIGRRV